MAVPAATPRERFVRAVAEYMRDRQYDDIESKGEREAVCVAALAKASQHAYGTIDQFRTNLAASTLAFNTQANACGKNIVARYFAGQLRQGLRDLDTTIYESASDLLNYLDSTVTPR